MSELLAEKAANGGNLPQSGGSAWAAITAPGAGPVWDKTAVEARVDPGAEQSKLGTSLSKSVPLSDQYSLTLQNGYNVIQQGTSPVPGIVARPSPELRDRPVGQGLDRPTPAPASPPARRCRPTTTNGCASSAPSRSCSTTSPSPARSARPRKARPARASARDSSRAGECRLSSPNHTPRRSRPNDPALPQLGRDAVKIGRPDGPADISNSSCGGHSRSLNANRGKPMNTMRPEKTESTETEVDTDLAAVTEVEAGIRDFVRNDIAYLRRPAAVTSTEAAARSECRSHRQQRQFADPARRRHLARRNREPDFRTREPARTAPCRRPARPARDLGLRPAQPGRDEVDPHDRRQRRAVEARRRRPAQQLIAQRNRRPPPPHSTDAAVSIRVDEVRKIAAMSVNVPIPARDQTGAVQRRGRYRPWKASGRKTPIRFRCGRAAPGGHDHDPLRRTADRGDRGAGDGLEPLTSARRTVVARKLTSLLNGSLRPRGFERIGAVGVALHHHPVVNITASVTVAKIKPTSFKPLRSAMVVPP